MVDPKRWAWTALAAGLLWPAAALAHPLELEPARQPGAYFLLGIEHIVLGWDHLLFVLGLVLVTDRVWTLLWTLTAFSIAHSLTLIGGVLGYVHGDPAWVEPAIALSIAYVGVENLLRRRPSGRIVLTSAFGLIHGLGFAGALGELGLPPGREVAALTIFNLGVEAGQLLSGGIFFMMARYLTSRPSMGRVAMVVMNLALVGAGLGWTIERVSGAPQAHAASKTTTLTTTTPGDAPPAAAVGVAPRSIFPKQRAQVDPRVQKLCRAIHTLPRRRRAECAGRQPGVTLQSECERTLGASVRDGAIELDHANVDACVEGLVGLYEGCAWTDRTRQPALPACARWATGSRTEGQSCRSSLECDDGLHCHGVGPMDRGTCGAPKEPTAACGRAVDPLGAYVQHRLERDHPECQGQCLRGRCAPASR